MRARANAIAALHLGAARAVAFTLLLAACASPKYPPVASATTAAANASFASHAAVDLTWEKMPTEMEMGSFLFQTYRTSTLAGTEVPQDLGDTVSVFLWMPSMGHGSSPVTVERLGAGRYRASAVFFLMKGDWEIHFQVKNGKDISDEAVLAITY